MCHADGEIIFLFNVPLSMSKVKMAECRGYFTEVQALTNKVTLCKLFLDVTKRKCGDPEMNLMAH